MPDFGRLIFLRRRRDLDRQVALLRLRARAHHAAGAGIGDREAGRADLAARRKGDVGAGGELGLLQLGGQPFVLQRQLAHLVLGLLALRLVLGGLRLDVLYLAQRDRQRRADGAAVASERAGWS